jgi:hypothetical protein
VLGDAGLLLGKFRAAATAPETLARRDETLKHCRALQADQLSRDIQRQLEEQQRRIRAVPVSPSSSTPYQVARLDRAPVPPVATDCDGLVVSSGELAALAKVGVPPTFLTSCGDGPVWILRTRSAWTSARSRSRT